MMKKFLISVYLLFAFGEIFAHPMPGSAVELSVPRNYIHGKAKIPLPELENAVGIDRASKLSDPFFLKYFTDHIQAVSDGKSWITKIENISVASDHDDAIGNYKEAVVSFTLLPAADSKLRNFTFNYDAVIHQVVTHSAIVSVTSDWSSGRHDSQTLGIIKVDVSSGKIFPLQVNLGEGSSWKGFAGMVKTGMEHIREGTDHLLFIITLLIPAMLLVQNRKWNSFGGIKYSISNLLRIVTAFTIGHSITLLAGSFGWLRLPSKPVEILIGISILISAVHAIQPIYAGRENLVAGGFGLIHGLAFATVLSNLGLDTPSLILSVLGFNTGIELMQLFVIALIVPWLMLISMNKCYTWIRLGIALFSGIAAMGWIIERFTGANNIVTAAVENIATNSFSLIASLAGIAMMSLILKQRKSQDLSMTS